VGDHLVVLVAEDSGDLAVAEAGVGERDEAGKQAVSLQL